MTAAVAERTPDDHHGIDLRLVIPILIGLVSLVAAVLTWRAAQLGENATDNDRQSISDTVLVAQSRDKADTQLADDQQAFSEYRIAVQNADLLDDQVKQLSSAGLDGEARVLGDEANSQRETAANLATRTFGLTYVSTNDQGEVVFDVDQRRADLLAFDRETAKLNPDGSAATAQDLRDGSQWKMAWVVALVGVIVILTVAQVSRRPNLKIALTGTGFVLFVVCTVAGFAR